MRTSEPVESPILTRSGLAAILVCLGSACAPIIDTEIRGGLATYAAVPGALGDQTTSYGGMVEGHLVRNMVWDLAFDARLSVGGLAPHGTSGATFLLDPAVGLAFTGRPANIGSGVVFELELPLLIGWSPFTFGNWGNNIWGGTELRAWLYFDAIEVEIAPEIHLGTQVNELRGSVAFFFPYLKYLGFGARYSQFWAGNNNPSGQFLVVFLAWDGLDKVPR